MKNLFKNYRPLRVIGETPSTKTRKTVVIYFDADKKQKQLIHPTDKWDNNAFALVSAIARSDDKHKGYVSFEIL